MQMEIDESTIKCREQQKQKKTKKKLESTSWIYLYIAQNSTLSALTNSDDQFSS